MLAKKLSIFHTNDFHNQMDSESIKVSLRKNQPFLLLDSGDAIAGSNTIFKRREPILEEMNELGYHAMAMGNREFHYCRKVFHKRIETMKFPLLSANLIDLRGNSKVKSHILYHIEGINIGLIGLTVPQYKENSILVRLFKYKFLDPIKAARDAVEELKKKGALLIIVLSHLGIEWDCKIAQQIEGIDIILGGHSHTLLEKPVQINNTFVCQNGARGKYMGWHKIELNLDNEGNRKTFHMESKLIALEKVVKRILFISNGFGEDTIAGSIIQEFRKITSIRPPEKVINTCLFAFPLVGDGGIYKKAGVKIVAPCLNMPSGGISGYLNLHNFWQDIKSGLLRLTIKQAKSLLILRKKVNLCIAVGDVFSVIMAILFLRKPVIFIGTAKSDYVSPYSWLERLILKRVKLVLPRDMQTANTLKKKGINSEYLGNAMMDSLEFNKKDFGKFEGFTIGILPGSRTNAYDDFLTILEALYIMHREASFALRFLVAVPDTLDLTILMQKIQGNKWKKSIIHDKEGMITCTERNNLCIELYKDLFGDILKCSDIIIGQAGTGNEQAVGLGKPTIAFDNFRGGKISWYRYRQKRLLGDSVSIVKAEANKIAKEALNIIKSPAKLHYMAKVGRERMGAPGAAKKIALKIYKALE